MRQPSHFERMAVREDERDDQLVSKPIAIDHEAWDTMERQPTVASYVAWCAGPDRDRKLRHLGYRINSGHVAVDCVVKNVVAEPGVPINHHSYNAKNMQLAEMVAKNYGEKTIKVLKIPARRS